MIRPYAADIVQVEHGEPAWDGLSNAIPIAVIHVGYRYSQPNLRNYCLDRHESKHVITIRKARNDDAQEIWGIRNAAIRSQCKDHYSPEELAIWTSGEMTEQFIKVIEDSFYVATLDSHVAGTGMLNLESGKVDAIFVHPSHMRTGIGRQVLSHLEKLALDAGLAQLSLDSTLNAAPFYRGCGFVGDSIAKYVSPRGISLDCIPMIKSLGKLTQR